MEKGPESKKDIGTIRKIESGSYFQKSREDLNVEYKNVLSSLFDLLKDGRVKLRVKHKKKENSWSAEIYFIDTGNVWYHTDFPKEVQDLSETLLKNGYEPEYIEEE